jgi:hypothetical protein
VSACSHDESRERREAAAETRVFTVRSSSAMWWLFQVYVVTEFVREKSGQNKDVRVEYVLDRLGREIRSCDGTEQDIGDWENNGER